MAGGGFRRSLRQFTFGKGKSAGRNNTGQITIWHRGGGAKRSQRIIDVKRNTPAIGYVERIEYDPNRSTRIALVRWKEMDEKKFSRMEEEFDRPEMNPEPVTAAVQGGFALASLPGKDVFKDGLKVVVDGVSPGLKSVAGLVSIPVGMPSSKRHIVSKGVGSSKLTSVKDVFASAVSPGTVPVFPRIAVAGAKSPFFAFGTKEEVGGKNAFSLSEIQRWKMDSPVWEHRLKRKAAVSWTGISGHNEKPKMDQGLYAKAKNGMPGPDRAAVSYIIATHQMKVGSMVMNCEWSKPSTKEVQRSAN